MDTNIADLATNLHNAFVDCLFKDNEDTTHNIKVEGITCTFHLHPERLESKRELVQNFLNNLPSEFAEGYTFMALPFTKTGAQWGEQPNAQELMVMAIGLNLMTYCFPKERWNVLPGGVPYVQLVNEDKAIMTENKKGDTHHV